LTKKYAINLFFILKNFLYLVCLFLHLLKNSLMKKIFLLLAPLFLTFTSLAQQLPLPDINKAQAVIHAQKGTPVPCGGSAKYLSVDLDWQPVVYKKRVSHEPEMENKKLIDSIKQLKSSLKADFEEKHVKSGAKTTSVTPAIGTNFSGAAPDGSSPLDNSIAISKGGIIVSVENELIACYNSSGTTLSSGTITAMLPFTGLWGVCDPVVLYDPTSDRFIFFAQEINASGLFSDNRIFICFSKTNNPATGGWWCYSFIGDPTGNGDGYDYPKMAINDSEVFLSGNLYYEPSGTYHQSVIFQIDKLSGYAGGTVNYVYYASIPGDPFTPLPVSYGQDDNITTGMVLVASLSGGGSSIKLYEIVGNWCCSPSLFYWTVPTTPYAVAGDALQLGTSTQLKTGDCRMLSGFYLNDIIHFVFNVDKGAGYTGVNYNRLNLVTLTNASSVYGLTSFDCAYPSVVSFATTATDKSVMIGFGKSGSSAYPDISVVNCDDGMSWSAATSVKSGSYVNYGGSTARWGDYTGTSRKHNSSTPSIWMNGMYGNSAHKWATWIAEVHAGATTSCAVPTGLSVSSTTSVTASLNWTAVTGAVSYNIQYRKVGTTPWSSTTATGTSAVVSGLIPGTAYEFQVQTVCAGSVTSVYSGSGNFSTQPTALPNTQMAQAKIYPNPVVQKFSVEFSLLEQSILNISLVDVSGRLVKELYTGIGTSGDNVFSFNKGNLATGQYLLIIKAENKIVRNEKIVIAD
jgi:hypothetical protein